MSVLSAVYLYGWYYNADWGKLQIKNVENHNRVGNATHSVIIIILETDGII